MRSYLLLVPGLVIGFALAWWLKPAPSPASSSGDVPAGGPGTPPKLTLRDESPAGRAAGVPSPEVGTELLSEWLGSGRGEARDRLLAQTSAAEAADLIALLEQRAGIFGLDHRERDCLEILLTHWYRLEPQGALAWLGTLKKGKDGPQLIFNLINNLSREDLGAAIELARGHGFDQDGKRKLPDELLRRSAAEGAGKLLEMVELGITDSAYSSTTAVEFPPDFDFGAFARGLAALHDSLTPEQRFSMRPDNLLRDWAKVDPEAAYVWMSENPEVYGKDSLKDFCEGYMTIHGARETGGLIARHYASAPPDQPDTLHRALWSFVDEAGSLDPMEGFLAEAPDIASRQDLLVGMLQWANRSWGGHFNDTFDRLVEGMDPADRITALGQQDILSQHHDRLKLLLRRLGHSEAEISAVIGTP